MVIPFTQSATNPLLAQPDAAGETLYVRSTDASDTMDVEIHGDVASSYSSAVLTLTGQREVQGITSFETLLHVILTGAPAGDVSIFGQGEAGTGQMIVDTVPANASTLTVGLTGFTTAYTFRSPCRETIGLPATGASLVTGASAASYVKITLNGTAKYFWFSNGTTTDPAPGGTGYAVSFTGADADTVLAAALRASMVTNLTNFATSVSGAVVTITGIALGAITISQDAGADFTLTAIEAGTADAAYQIRTGYHTDGAVATVAQIADYIDRALDASGTAGTHYGTSTVAHPTITSTVSGESINMTDRIACNRQLAWSFAQSGSHFSLPSVLSGGTDGTELATIAAGGTQANDEVNLGGNEDLSNANLPAGFSFISDAIVPNGGRVTLNLLASSTPIACSYQTSTDDGTTWRAGATSLSNIGSGTFASVQLAELAIERMRFLITNAGAVARNVHAKAIIG